MKFVSILFYNEDGTSNTVAILNVDRCQTYIDNGKLELELTAPTDEILHINPKETSVHLENGKTKGYIDVTNAAYIDVY